jgi:hypothetical protein
MIAPLQTMETPEWLNTIVETKTSDGFPLKSILQNSLYYPASGLNGTPVKYLGGNIHSFIYADYGISRRSFLRNLHGIDSGCGFKGYRLVMQQDIHRDDLVPPDWIPPLIPQSNPHYSLLKGNESACEQFTHWSVWKRRKGFSHQHGPDAFSFLFIGGEMSAVYQGLYSRNSQKPLVLAVIQPGCMGGEWENVESDSSFFKKVVLSNPAGMSEYLLYGGIGKGYYEKPCWGEYVGDRLIQLPERYAGLWKLNEVLLEGNQKEPEESQLNNIGVCDKTERLKRYSIVELHSSPGFFLSLKPRATLPNETEKSGIPGSLPLSIFSICTHD